MGTYPYPDSSGPPAPPADPARPPLDPSALRRAVRIGHGLWTRLEVVAETGSTNADLVAAARAGAPEGTVLVAEHQHAGRGRAGRTWSAPPRAGLAVSVLLRPGVTAGQRPAVPVARWSWLPLLAGVALVAAVRRATGLPARLKWPNDLLVHGRKCAGILAESTAEAVVIGIGMNVTERADELPAAAPAAEEPAAEEPAAEEPAAVPATSLALAGAPHPDRAALLAALLGELADRYTRWCAAAGDADRSGVRPTYLTDSATVGHPVRVLLPGGEVQAGEAVGVDDGGGLVLRTPDGRWRTLAAGEVTHLRAA